MSRLDAHWFLQMSLQRTQLRYERLCVTADPAVVDEPDGYRIQEVELLSADPPGCHQVGRFEDAEMLHDAEPAHRQVRLQLQQRLAISLEEPVKEQPAAWVRQGFEYLVHGRDNR